MSDGELKAKHRKCRKLCHDRAIGRGKSYP